MSLLWTDLAWEDYLYWADHNPKIVRSIDALIKDIKRVPFSGLGKPEPLRHDWQGWWSRRITGEHRLVYRIIGKADEQRLQMVQCRYYY